MEIAVSTTLTAVAEPGQRHWINTTAVDWGDGNIRDHSMEQVYSFHYEIVHPFKQSQTLTGFEQSFDYHVDFDRESFYSVNEDYGNYTEPNEGQSCTYCSILRLSSKLSNRY